MNIEQAVWRKASRSGGNGGDCVEVADNLGPVVAVRDSKNPTGPVLVFDRGTWREFVANVHDGQFDL
jgi:Domain of unknown function (DUF397)